MERSGSGGTKAGTGDVAGSCGCALACCVLGDRVVDSAACFCGRMAWSWGEAGSVEPDAAGFEERSKASEGCAFGAGSGSSFFAVGAASSGETISTAIGSAGTELNGCTSAKTRTIVRADRWPIADASMPERMNRRGSTVLNQRFRSRPGLQHSGQRRRAVHFFCLPSRFSIDGGGRSASIPFRRETEIGQPALGASHLGYLVHLVGRQREVEDVDIFRQPFDPRRPRYRGNVLLHQPAQANLRRGLAVCLPDKHQRLVADRKSTR